MQILGQSGPENCGFFCCCCCCCCCCCFFFYTLPALNLCLQVFTKLHDSSFKNTKYFPASEGDTSPCMCKCAIDTDAPPSQSPPPPHVEDGSMPLAPHQQDAFHVKWVMLNLQGQWTCYNFGGEVLMTFHTPEPNLVVWDLLAVIFVWCVTAANGPGGTHI